MLSPQRSMPSLNLLRGLPLPITSSLNTRNPTFSLHLKYHSHHLNPPLHLYYQPFLHQIQPGQVKASSPWPPLPCPDPTRLPNKSSQRAGEVGVPRIKLNLVGVFKKFVKIFAEIFVIKFEFWARNFVR